MTDVKKNAAASLRTIKPDQSNQKQKQSSSRHEIIQTITEEPFDERIIEPIGSKMTGAKKDQSLLESAIFKQKKEEVSSKVSFNQTARITLPGSKRQSLIHNQSEAVLKSHQVSKEEPLTSRQQGTPNQIMHSQSNTQLKKGQVKKSLKASRGSTQFYATQIVSGKNFKI